jgi:cobalt-zinc-cadmium efflux system outer membrane protein
MVTALRQEQMGGADNQTNVEVEWPLQLGRRPARIAAAEREVDVARGSVAERERVLANAVRAQAGRVLATRRIVAIADEALTSTRSLRDLLERRASEGAIPQLEANLSSLEMWRIEADRAFAVAEADVAAIELRTLLGLPADAPLALGESLEAIVRAPADEPAAVAARADLLEAQARVALADARIDAARGEGGLDASVFGGYSRMRFGFEQLGLSHTGAHVPIQGIFHNVAVGTTLTVPLWNRNQGAIAAAEAERDAARALVAARELAGRAEIEAAAVRDREARRAVELYGASIRALAQRNADVMLEAYELGAVPLTDLLDNQRRYLDIERTYTDTLLKAYDARVALRRARGEIR